MRMIVRGSAVANIRRRDPRETAWDIKCLGNLLPKKLPSAVQRSQLAKIKAIDNSLP